MILYDIRKKRFGLLAGHMAIGKIQTNMLKILQIITSLEIGGAEKLLVDLIPRLRERGLFVDLLLINGKETVLKKQLQQNGITVYQLSKNGYVYNPIYIYKMSKYIKKYNIIHTHNTASQLFAAISNLFYSKILVTTEHNTYNRRRNLRWYRPIDQWMYNQYRHIICISKEAETNLHSYMPKLQCQISTIYNGIDIKKYANANLIKLPVPLNSKTVTMVAGFRIQKDQKTVIKAMAKLPQNYHLLLIGDGECRLECEKLAISLNINDKIHFLGIRQDIPDILHSSDIIVLSSHYEGLSLSSIEGMACGRPFIASDVPGLHEAVDGAGILFKHENAQQLAEIIKKLIDDNTFYQTTVLNCYKRAIKYDIKYMIDGYEKVYIKLAM